MVSSIAYQQFDGKFKVGVNVRLTAKIGRKFQMKKYSKKDFPVSKIRQILEPGPVVLVSSAWKGKKNIMTMGWHLVMEFSPSLVGCIIADNNVSFEMIRKSGVCVINVPTADMVDQVVGVGNCDGDEVD